MADTSKALGKPVPFEFEGTTYQLSQLTYDDQAKFELFLESRAVAALQRHKKSFADEEYRKNFLDLIADITVGRYSFGGQECADAAKSIPGLKELFYISISKLQPECNRQFVDHVFDVKIQEATATMGAANADPFQKVAVAAQTP